MPADSVNEGNAAVQATISYTAPPPPPASPPEFVPVSKQSILIDTPYRLPVTILNSPDWVRVTGVYEQDFYYDWKADEGICYINGQPTRELSNQEWVMTCGTGTGASREETDRLVVEYDIVAPMPEITDIGRITLHQGVDLSIRIPLDSYSNPTVDGLLIGMGYKKDGDSAEIFGQIPATANFTTTEGTLDVFAKSSGGEATREFGFDLVPGVPPTISDLTAVPADNRITISFTGARNALQYAYTLDPPEVEDRVWVTFSGTTHVIRELDSGFAYKIYVRVASPWIGSVDSERSVTAIPGGGIHRFVLGLTSYQISQILAFFDSRTRVLDASQTITLQYRDVRSIFGGCDLGNRICFLVSAPSGHQLIFYSKSDLSQISADTITIPTLPTSSSAVAVVATETRIIVLRSASSAQSKAFYWNKQTLERLSGEDITLPSVFAWRSMFLASDRILFIATETSPSDVKVYSYNRVTREAMSAETMSLGTSSGTIDGFAHGNRYGFLGRTGQGADDIRKIRYYNKTTRERVSSEDIDLPSYRNSGAIGRVITTTNRIAVAFSHVRGQSQTENQIRFWDLETREYQDGELIRPGYHPRSIEAFFVA